MLKRTITYKDLDGGDVTEDFYFNLTTAEIAEMEMSQHGGLESHLKKILADEDGAQIISTFKMIIQKSIGKRSEDNRRFIKNQEITDDFMQTDAYTKVFMELVTDAEAGANFINGIVPAEFAAAMRADVTDVELPKPWIAENREPTQAELMSMSQADLQAAFLAKNNPASQ